MEVERCRLCNKQFNPDYEHTCNWDDHEIALAQRKLERFLGEFETLESE